MTRTYIQTFYNAAGDKLGIAVWSGERDARNMMVGWEVFNLSDHSLGVVRYMTGARDLLEGECPTCQGKGWYTLGRCIQTDEVVMADCNCLL